MYVMAKEELLHKGHITQAIANAGNVTEKEGSHHE
jgi:hypothetical protein